MNGLLLHERSKHELSEFLLYPKQSILIVGPKGSGKHSVAKVLVATILGIEQNKVHEHQSVLYISAEKSTISIDAIRRSQEFVRLKTAGKGKIRRIIFVDGAHHMTKEAQNAFLKLLEEPPEDCMIVMTTDSQDALLATIRSRTNTLLLKPPSKETSSSYFMEKGHSTDEVHKAYLLSRGYAGLMTTILEHTTDDATLASLETAKQFLVSKKFERLVIADTVAKKSSDLTSFLWGLQRICDAALHQAIINRSDTQIRYWIKASKLALDSQETLKANPNVKLLLTDLALQL